MSGTMRWILAMNGKLIQDVTPLLELTYEQALDQMLSVRRKGAPIEVIDWSPRYELAIKTMKALDNLALEMGWV